MENLEKIPTVPIRVSGGSTIEITIEDDMTILEIKKLIEEEGINMDQQDLILNGQRLDNTKTMKDYSITTESILYLVKRKKMGNEAFNVLVVGSEKQKIFIQVEPTDTIEDLKDKIAVKLNIIGMALFYNKKEIKPGETMKDIGIKNNDSILITVFFRGG